MFEDGTVVDNPGTTRSAEEKEARQRFGLAPEETDRFVTVTIADGAVTLSPKNLLERTGLVHPTIIEKGVRTVEIHIDKNGQPTYIKDPNTKGDSQYVKVPKNWDWV